MEDSSKVVNTFDPIVFLDLDNSIFNDNPQLKDKLESNIYEYLLIKLLQELPDSVDPLLENGLVANEEELESVLKFYIPDLKEKTLKYLNNFKEDYDNARE